MVMYCVAFGCTNEQVKNKTPFHRFPFKRPEILNLWIEAVCRENWTPSKTSRLCGEHFLQSDYLDQPGYARKFLKPDAVPSIFQYPKDLSPKTSVPHRKILKKDVYVDAHNLNLPTSSKPFSNIKILVDCQTQTDTVNMEDKINVLRREVKTLRQKVKRRDLKITNMKRSLIKILKSRYRNLNLDGLKKHFKGIPLEIIILQLEKD